MIASSIQTRRTSLTLATLVSLGLAATSAQAQSPFKAGDIVVSRVGDGTQTLVNTGNSVFLDEYTTTGTLVQSIALPSSGASAFVESGTATSEGQLTLSSNGQYLTLAGYNVAPGGSSSVTSSTTIARGVAEIGVNGVASTSFFNDTSFSGNNIRSAASTDGSTIYATGGVGGVRSTTFGSGSSTQSESATTNTRVTNIYNGTLYYSTGSTTGNAGVGIYSLGSTSGLSGAPITPTAVVTEATNSSPYDFVFTNANTLFVANDVPTTGGAAAGLAEFTSTGPGSAFTATTIFSLPGLTAGTTAGLRSLTSNGTDIFGISTDNRLVDFNLATMSFSTIATGTTNTAFRGVDFAPTPPAVPEASTTVSFGLLLVLGLGGVIVARRRKQA